MKKDLLKEIATRNASIDHWSQGYYLPNPDPVLKRLGKDISAYRELLSDPHLSGCVRRRKAAIKGLEWRITPTGNDKADKVLTECLYRLDMNHIITEMMNAMLFGYQVLEVIWANQDGYLLPVDIKGKPQEWFIFDDDNLLRMRTKEDWMVGMALPERKFLLITQEASYTNPYGIGDLSKCFWAATFKKGGLKFWLEFIEKYGSPWLIGKHHRSATDAEKDLLVDSLEAMIGTAIAAIPDDSSVEIVESASKGASSDSYEQFLRYCKAEIAIAILGQNQTTEADANRASATAGLEVAEDLRNDDMAMVASGFNQLLSWICELNFAVAQVPIFELYEQESIDKVQAERDVLLSQLGVVFSEQYLQRVYGFEEGDISIQSSTHQASIKQTDKADDADGKADKAQDDTQDMDNDVDDANFAERDTLATDGIQAQLVDKTAPIINEHLAIIERELADCQSFAEFSDKLDGMMDKLSFDEYAKLFASAMTASHLMGRYEVEAERHE